jgi:hypothetical protein
MGGNLWRRKPRKIRLIELRKQLVNDLWRHVWTALCHLLA